MAQPQSLLAELRALESKRAQEGLSPPEELRLAELRAVAGHAPTPAAGPRGFDVNAAAAALREALPPVALPPPPPPRAPPPPPAEEAPVTAPPAEALAEPAGLAPPEELAGTTPPEEEAAAPARDEGGTSALGEVPADWSSWQEPEQGGPGAAPPEEEAASGWDPAVEAAWEAYARERGWDPAAPWDEQTAAFHWDGFLRSMGWIAAPADQPVDQPAELPGAAPVAQPVDWSAEPPPDRPDAPPFAGAVAAVPGTPAKESDTASWDLGTVLTDPGAQQAGAGVPDERDPGTTAQWSLAQVTGASAPAAAAFKEEEPEPVLLDELQLESEGSFGPAGPAHEAPPPAPAEEPAGPVEVSDEEIIEVGDGVGEEAEAAPGTPAGALPAEVPAPEVPAEELPVVEAVELAELTEEPPLPAPAAAEPPPPESLPPGPLSFEPVPPEPQAPEASATDTSPEPWLAGSAPAEVLPPEALPPEPWPPEPAPPEPGPAPAAVSAGPPGGEPVPLESLTIDEEPLVEEPGAPQGRLVPGLHRVVLHTVEGQVMRGVLQDPDLLAAVVALSPQPSAPPEPVAAERLRAIFFMLSPGEKAPDAAGLKVRVTFRDGRQVAGFSRDYDPEAPGFFMVPAESRTNTARIWVYRSAVRQVAVS